jgi:hypothetical protein
MAVVVVVVVVRTVLMVLGGLRGMIICMRVRRVDWHVWQCAAPRPRHARPNAVRVFFPEVLAPEPLH